MQKVFLGLMCGITAFSLLLSGCSKANDNSSSKPVTLNIRSAPKTIDPQLSTSVPGSQVDAMCMEGLIRQGKNTGKMYAAGAEKWDVSKDGKIWTFYLRKNAKWSNGENITAKDYYFGMKRLLMPSTAAQYSYMLYYIRNAELFNTGKIKDFSQVGIKIIDDYTLQLTLDKPVPFFAQILTSPCTFPVNEKFYNKVKDRYALDKNSLLYNGPYIIKEWIPNGKYLMTKNPYYWNKSNIHVKNVNMMMIEDYNTAANMYKSNELDIAPMSGDQLPLFTNEKIRKVPDSVWYLQFNVDNKYFKNKKIRQAVSMAINRKVFCNGIRKDGSIPAYAFVPPGISGGKVNGKPVSFRQHFGDKYFSYNVTKAKELFKEGLKELGLKEPVTLKLITDNSDVSRRDGQFIQQELFKNLGINIILEPNTFQSRLVKMDQQDYDFVYAGWLPDYNDPDTFVNMWVTNGGNNRTGFSSIKYDKYINTEESSFDNDVRMKAMYNAEKLLMDKMIIAPLYYRSSNWLVKPYIKDFVIRGVGIQTSFVWAYLDKDAINN
jgi:oligopeptide transport system substrate-binding protein